MEPRPDWIDPADAADPVTPSSMKEEIAAKTPSMIPLRAAKGNWTEFASMLPTASIKLAVSTVLPHSLEFVRSGFEKKTAESIRSAWPLSKHAGLDDSELRQRGNLPPQVDRRHYRRENDARNDRLDQPSHFAFEHISDRSQTTHHSLPLSERSSEIETIDQLSSIADTNEPVPASTPGSIDPLHVLASRSVNNCAVAWRNMTIILIPTLS